MAVKEGKSNKTAISLSDQRMISSQSSLGDLGYGEMLNFTAVDMLKKITFGNTVVGLGQHNGKADLGKLELSEDELKILTALSPRKQVEWVSSRELLHQISRISPRPLCLYDDFGKPYLAGSDKHISISHSERWCAAMVSDTPCGVDVQVYTATVRRIADRFLTADDLKKLNALRQANDMQDVLPLLHLYWGGKECLYKAYGKRKLGFREHLFISDIDFKSKTALGKIIFEHVHLSYDIKFELLPEVAWVYCTARDIPPTDDSE